jgi:hypothetical protein
MKLVTEAFTKRVEDLQKNYELLSPRLVEHDRRISKIESYIDEIPYRLRRGEFYEALFAITRVATMLGEIRIEYRTDAEVEKQSPLLDRIRVLEEENEAMKSMLQARGPQGV